MHFETFWTLPPLRIIKTDCRHMLMLIKAFIDRYPDTDAVESTSEYSGSLAHLRQADRYVLYLVGNAEDRVSVNDSLLC